MGFLDDRSVLVVDDDPIVRDLVTAALVSDGFSCVEASDGEQAIELFAASPTSIVLSDVVMPGLNGIELLEAIRNLSPATIVILLTGSADVDMVVSAMRSGVTDFIQKPFTLDTLRERLRSALLAHRAQVAALNAAKGHEDRLARLAEQYRDLSHGVVESLTTALGAKHPETRAHSERVAVRAAELAGKLGLDQSEVEGLYVAGLLHDVGKVAVDSTILNKPGLLDPNEFDQIRSHPKESERIVAPIAFSAVTVSAIRYHHERFDGNGYPDGLSAQEIPLPARILAVCDAYDAMTTRRAYSPALSSIQAVNRLRDGAGSQWDPRIVEMFVELLTADSSTFGRAAVAGQSGRLISDEDKVALAAS